MQTLSWKGGNVTLSTGEAPLLDEKTGTYGEHGDVVFLIGGLDGHEVLRLCGDGRILVNGEQVEEDRDLVEGFRTFLRAAGIALP
jgi:hypothetical protein